MERLTQWLPDGKGGRVAALTGSVEEKYTVMGLIDLLLARLALYEDTGRTPEEVALGGVRCVHKTEAGRCLKFSGEDIISYCVEEPCPYCEPSVADRIRSMTDEDLADAVLRAWRSYSDRNGEDISLRWCDQNGDCADDGEIRCSEEKIRACIIRWLRSPAKGGTP